MLGENELVYLFLIRVASEKIVREMVTVGEEHKKRQVKKLLDVLEIVFQSVSVFLEII